MVRPLGQEETRIATIDADGYPHVTPLWFLWADGQQVRAVGDAVLIPDAGGAWTMRIWGKYIHGNVAVGPAERLSGRQRMLIRIVPSLITAVTSV